MDKKLLDFGRIGITLSFFASTLLYATNGDNLIGVGTKARGMGGAGIAVHHGAESILQNPALITDVENTEVSFGGTIFMPDIKTQLNTNPQAPLPLQNKLTSDADFNIIPEVSLAQKINKNFYIGVGMWGTAGMGVDYSQGEGIRNTISVGQFSNFDMVTNLQLMQFAVPIAYKANGLSVAIAPILQYGNLDINYAMPIDQQGTINSFGAGLAQDLGFGCSIGLIYDFSNGLSAGAVYKSKIDIEYTNQLTTATVPFGIILSEGDHLQQPAELGIGLAYTMGQHTFAVDYKNIKWSDSKGYQDFGWVDQHVMAFGYEFSQDNWTLRAGYNHGSSPVKETANPAINMFNLLGFPATAKQHYTIGGTYEITHQLSIDLAYVYSPTATKTFDVSQLGMGIDTVTTDHLESSASFQLTYRF
ncbi:MAG: porin [Campylobacterales bacterium]|nr:porin [Campylobacterales bacterium]